jgi:hypothetical protein
MSKTITKTADFLKAMQPVGRDDSSVPFTKPALPADAPSDVVPVAPKATRKHPSRAGLKHFGGYLDDDTLEKIALLRVRLKKDNSELIRQAINELHANYMAKRAFGDV